MFLQRYCSNLVEFTKGQQELVKHLQVIKDFSLQALAKDTFQLLFHKCNDNFQFMRTNWRLSRSNRDLAGLKG